MQVYHEAERTCLSEHRIFFMKSVTESPGEMVPFHWHNSYEILFVRRGTCEQRINAKVFQCKPGCVVLICPGDIHATHATARGGCEIDVLQFSEEYFGERRFLLRELTSVTADLPRDGTFPLFDVLCKNAEANEGGRMLVLSGALFLLCGLLADRCGQGEATTAKTPFVQAVSKYLYDAELLGLQEVAKIFGYSTAHFSRKFHREFGVTYQYYCDRIKMQRFLDHLEREDTSLEAVAERLGYSNACSFVRAFKRIYGITPGAYRKLKNGGI